jgi:hypothetical protein
VTTSSLLCLYTVEFSAPSVALSIVCLSCEEVSSVSSSRHIFCTGDMSRSISRSKFKSDGCICSHSPIVIILLRL